MAYAVSLSFPTLGLLSTLVNVPSLTPRPPLTRERVVRAAVELADREGLAALTMRRLGAELGVQAMSLYKHVANKDQILDEVVEEIFGGIEVTGVDAGWEEAMRRRAHATRTALSAHPWAIGLLESRGASGPASTRYVDAVLGCLRSAGFSVEEAAHAFWTLDSFVYGHVLQESRTSAPPGGRADGEASTADVAMSDYPHLAEVAERASEFSVDAVFDYGLELILAALSGARARRA